MNRRSLITATLSIPAALAARHIAAQPVPAAQTQYPIGWPGEIPANGFIIRHGYACENTWYNPGFLHTGEDWYAIEGDTAGAEVLAIAAGKVVFAGSDYPGRVVIVQHDELFSMYGHLDYALDAETGDAVEIGQRLGTVLHRTDGAAPSHLHFEVRTFLTTPEVNGNQPRYGFACGRNCPPGPGYWPIDAPEHPTAMGWRNPTHVIARRMFPGGEPPARFELIVPNGFDGTVPIWSLPFDRTGAGQTGEISLSAGETCRLLDVATGLEASAGWSAEQYRLWYRIEQSNGDQGWVQAAIPSTIETGGDGKPSAIILSLVPVFRANRATPTAALGATAGG